MSASSPCLLCTSNDACCVQSCLHMTKLSPTLFPFPKCGGFSYDSYCAEPNPTFFTIRISTSPGPRQSRGIEHRTGGMGCQKTVVMAALEELKKKFRSECWEEKERMSECLIVRPTEKASTIVGLCKRPDKQNTNKKMGQQGNKVKGGKGQQKVVTMHIKIDPNAHLSKHRNVPKDNPELISQ